MSLPGLRWSENIQELTTDHSDSDAPTSRHLRAHLFISLLRTYLNVFYFISTSFNSSLFDMMGRRPAAFVSVSIKVYMECDMIGGGVIANSTIPTRGEIA